MQVKLSKKALNFLEKAEEILHKRILEKIKKLAQDPYNFDCKRIEGREEKVFRVRVGDYRILYVVFEDYIFITKINKRSKVYKNN